MPHQISLEIPSSYWGDAFNSYFDNYNGFYVSVDYCGVQVNVFSGDYAGDTTKRPCLSIRYNDPNLYSRIDETKIYRLKNCQTETYLTFGNENAPVSLNGLSDDLEQELVFVYNTTENVYQLFFYPNYSCIAYAMDTPGMSNYQIWGVGSQYLSTAKWKLKQNTDGSFTIVSGSDPVYVLSINSEYVIAEYMGNNFDVQKWELEVCGTYIYPPYAEILIDSHNDTVYIEYQQDRLIKFLPDFQVSQYTEYPVGSGNCIVKYGSEPGVFEIKDTGTTIIKGTDISGNSFNITVNIIPQNGIFFIKDRNLGNYLAVQNQGNTSITSLEGYSGEMSQWWYLEHVSNGYYKIQSYYYDNDDLVLTNISNSIQLTEYNDSNPADSQLWLLTKVGRNRYKIQSKLDNSVLCIENSNSEELSLCSFNDTSVASNEWFIDDSRIYVLTVNNYFDNGYKLKNNFNDKTAIETIDNICFGAEELLYELLGVYVIFNTPAYYNSPIDQCVGNNSCNLSNACNCSGDDHLLLNNIKDSLESKYPNDNTHSIAYWTGYSLKIKIYNDNHTDYLIKNANSDYSYGYSVIMANNQACLTLAHELLHQLGAQDHYHSTYHSYNGQCVNIAICSDCNGVRPKTCIMAEGNAQKTYICSYCKTEILNHIYSHHDED